MVFMADSKRILLREVLVLVHRAILRALYWIEISLLEFLADRVWRTGAA